MQELNVMQSSLHTWEINNFVNFDSSKESKHIISKYHLVGEDFRILGYLFDCKLSMSACIHETVTSTNWKMRTLLRTQKYYTDRELVNLYKAHILSYLEYRTSAIFHAASSTLVSLDMIQNRFLRELGISVEDAAVHLNLLPLRVRRQIAILAIIKRAQLRRGPPQF